MYKAGKKQLNFVTRVCSRRHLEKKKRERMGPKVWSRTHWDTCINSMKVFYNALNLWNSDWTLFRVIVRDAILNWIAWDQSYLFTYLFYLFIYLFVCLFNAYLFINQSAYLFIYLIYIFTIWNKVTQIHFWIDNFIYITLRWGKSRSQGERRLWERDCDGGCYNHGRWLRLTSYNDYIWS